MSVTRELARGAHVANYRIEAVLGRGGMSTVYLAEDLRLKRRVALKVLTPELAEDERFRERFLAESELAASLDHANVVPIYEAGAEDGSLFIAMRYVEGSDLKAFLRDGPLPKERAVVLAGQVAGALDAAHELGLVHGDVKPSNVLIDARGHAYLADFGLTKRLADERSPAGEAQLMGTIDYVAPEQIRGEQVDGRADVYSLGCLLYECLTGKQPFKRGNDAAVLYAHLEDEPPATDTAADPVLARALAKSPDDRYQTCGELAEAARLALGVAVPRRSRWPLAIGGIAIAVGVASFLAVFLIRGGSSGAPTLTGRLLRIDPSTNRVSASVPVGDRPTGVGIGSGRVWVTTGDTPSIWRVAPKTSSASPVGVKGTAVDIAIDGRVGYVLGDDGTIARVDLSTGEPIAGDVHTPAGDQATVIEAGLDGIWAASDSAALRVGSVSPTVERILVRGVIPQPSPIDQAHFRFDVTGIASGDGAVWITGDAIDRRLFRVDPETARVDAVATLPFVPSSVVAGFGAVWVAAQLDDVVAKLNPETLRIERTIRVGREPTALAVGPASLWVANALDDTVSRIDPKQNRVVATVGVGATPAAIAAEGASVWVAGDAG